MTENADMLRGGSDQTMNASRPTEGQLRWAQFQLSKRAVRVRRAVDALWSTPENVADVTGAFSDDGNSSIASGSSSAVGNGLLLTDPSVDKVPHKRKRSKPKISRGRRALLRVSQRALEKRKNEMAQGKSLKIDDDDGLAEIFKEEAFFKKRRRRRRRTSVAEEERVRRFEAAFRNLWKQQHKQSEKPIISSTKKWTRSAPVQETIDGRVYIDLKWGVTPRVKTQQRHQGGIPPSASRDSDMQHNDDVPSHVGIQQHLQQVTKRYLAALTRTPKDGTSAQKNGFVRRFVAEMEEAAQREELITADGKLHKPTFAKLVLRYLDRIQMERQHRSRPKTPEFGIFRSPLALANARRSAGYINASRSFREEENLGSPNEIPFFLCESPEAMEEFVHHMELAFEEDTIVTSEGTLDPEALERLVTNCLNEAMLEWQQARQEASATPVKGSAGINLDYDGFPLTSDDRAHVFRGQQLSSLPPPNIAFEDQENGGHNQPWKKGPFSGMTSQLADKVSNKMGGLMKLFGNSNSSQPENEDDATALEAVAAFRRTQDERRASDIPGISKNDSASSFSSFRVADGFRNVVSKFRRSLQVDEKSHALSTSNIHENDYKASGGTDSFSPERLKLFHKKVMEQSSLLGSSRADSKSVIDTDGSDTTANASRYHAERVANLLLSPTILTKRHQQAVRAVENREWDQVIYLLSANPWLAEMTDVTSGQYLLHKLAYYGSGDDDGGMDAPESVQTDLVRMFPSSVHKFDEDGNLPLHMAAAAANATMITILGDRFSSGASVRNEDGMLPLHLAVLSCCERVPDGELMDEEEQNIIAHYENIVKSVIDYFPGAVAVADNEGNLPIHTAAGSLYGNIGVQIIRTLIDEAEKQTQDPIAGLRFRSQKSNHHSVAIALCDTDYTSRINQKRSEDATESTTPTDASPPPMLIMDNDGFDEEEPSHCLLVKNEHEETPLMTAIRSGAGWQVIAELASGEAGERAALMAHDVNGNNALHCLCSEPYVDPAAALSLLQVVPSAALAPNDAGVLPIEVACMHLLPHDVVLALVLVDLPIPLDTPEGVDSIPYREGFGASWTYLTCECDDHYIEVVEEVVALCTHMQLRALCFAPYGSVIANSQENEVLLSRTTPKCRYVLQRALRFLGRFELVSAGTHDSFIVGPESKHEIEVFEAIDFGPNDNPSQDGKRSTLHCFNNEELFWQTTEVVRENPFDFNFVEEVLVFAVGSQEDNDPEGPGIQRQLFLSIEQPSLSLEGVIRGMLGNEECQDVSSPVRQRYSRKIFSVLRSLAKSLRHLHSIGIVHGCVKVDNCCKYDEAWKVADTLNVKRVGSTCDPEEYLSLGFWSCIPPEALGQGIVFDTAFDSWGFGCLAFYALVGNPLVDEASFDLVRDWNDSNLNEVRGSLTGVGLSEQSVDMILSCLSPIPEQRATMDQVLCHPVWKELRRSSKTSSVSSDSV